MFFSKKSRKNNSPEKTSFHVHSALFEENGKKYIPKRKKNRLFSKKIEFENVFENVQKKNFYVYLLLGIALIFVLYVLLYSKYFAISRIEISRQSDAVNTVLAYEATNRFRKTPIFFAEKDVIAQSIRNFQPHVEIQSIRKIIPGTLSITLSAFPSLFWFFVGDAYYEITENGVIIPASPRESIRVLEIKEMDMTGVLEYKRFFERGKMVTIADFLQTIVQKYPLLDIQTVQYYTVSQELHIVNEKWVRFLFDLNRDLAVQLRKLNTFYTQYQSVIKKWLVYVDVRINEKIFYCGLESEFQCRLNLKNIYE